MLCHMAKMYRLFERILCFGPSGLDGNVFVQNIGKRKIRDNILPQNCWITNKSGVETSNLANFAPTQRHYMQKEFSVTF